MTNKSSVTSTCLPSKSGSDLKLLKQNLSSLMDEAPVMDAHAVAMDIIQ